MFFVFFSKTLRLFWHWMNTDCYHFATNKHVYIFCWPSCWIKEHITPFSFPTGTPVTNVWAKSWYSIIEYLICRVGCVVCKENQQGHGGITISLIRLTARHNLLQLALFLKHWRPLAITSVSFYYSHNGGRPP